MPTIENTRIPYSSIANADSRDWVDAYWEHGYLIITGVFNADEVARMATRCERWDAEGMRHPSTVRVHANQSSSGADRLVK